MESLRVQLNVQGAERSGAREGGGRTAGRRPRVPYNWHVQDWRQHEGLCPWARRRDRLAALACRRARPLLGDPADHLQSRLHRAVGLAHSEPP
jgi:hypothetical protein